MMLKLMINSIHINANNAINFWLSSKECWRWPYIHLWRWYADSPKS